MGDTHDLGLILDARVPIIVIESPDEKQVLELLLRFAMQRHLNFYQWSVTRGMRCGGVEIDAANAKLEQLASSSTHASGGIAAAYGPVHANLA